MSSNRISKKPAPAPKPKNENAQGSTAKGTDYTLTAGVDTFIGGNRADTFTATNTGAAQSLSSFDTIRGGAGADVLKIFSLGYAYEETGTYGVSVSGIESAILKCDRKVVLNTITWTDLTNLTVFAAGANSGATSVIAAATTAVSLTNLNAGGYSSTVNGGSKVEVTATDATGGGNINVGNTTATKGAVTINSTNTSNSTTSGSITVKGGTTINITTTQANSVNTTNTNGTVEITGSADTTAVTVTNAAKATSSANVAGVNVSSVNISDVNGGMNEVGKITSVTVNNFSTLSITNNALTSLTLSGGSGNIIIDNNGRTTPTNKTLALSINGLTSGTLDDADVYTTLNITTTGVNSTLSNCTFGAVTALNVAGSKVLTLTNTIGLSSLKTVTVSGSAGITADLSSPTNLTAVDTTASTGTTKVTVDATKATFTGGAGADIVTLGFTTPTKAIFGGTGTDTVTMGAAMAATASADSAFAGIVTGFENLTLTGATNQTIDLAMLGNFNYMSTSGGNGFKLKNLPTGGTLELSGAGTAYTIESNFSGLSDTVNLNLTSSSGNSVSFASTGITASGVENFVITTADTQATPSGTFKGSVSLLGNAFKSITVSGNAGLTLTANSTALTNVDASGISLGGFSYNSGALAAASVIKGSATGANTVDASAATGGAVTYTGGTGADTLTVGSGAHSLTLGTGADAVTFTSAGAYVGSYATITDAAKGDTLSFVNKGTETFTTAKVSLQGGTSFPDYVNAVIQAGGNASVNGAFGWFQFSGDTYLVQSRHDGSGGSGAFVDGTDMLIKLTGLVDLSTATGGTTNTLTLA